MAYATWERLRTRGWSDTLGLVTGYHVDLRALCDGNAMIAPSVIWLQKDPQAGASLLMGENRGQPAIDRLLQTLDALAEVMPSVQAAKFDLMDVDQLRSAATVAHHETNVLSDLTTSSQQLSVLTGASVDGTDGEYRRRLAVATDTLHQRAAAQHDSLSAGPRTLPHLLDDAADALDSFGMRMAHAFYVAQPELAQVAQTFWDGANTNLGAYWRANGWGPGGPNSRLFADNPEAAESRWRQAIAAYSSAGLPGLPAGTPVVTADLMDGWAAFGHALTARLGQILGTMDDEADAALTELEHAYQAVFTALTGRAFESTDAAPRLGGEAFSVPLRRTQASLTPATSGLVSGLRRQGELLTPMRSAQSPP